MDGNGYYWMAVGPKVVHEDYPSNGSPGSDSYQMYGTGTLDVALTKDNKSYYVRGVVGDIKAHTYDNGVIQTWYTYPNGEIFDTYAENWYDGQVCAEFIVKTVLTNEGEEVLPEKFSYGNTVNTLGNYSIDKIIFYNHDYPNI